MKYVNNFNTFHITENKMWYKTIEQMLSWLESKSNNVFVFLDTETTGLGGPKKQQLTQVSSIAVKWNSSNTIIELDEFDEKIKLTSDTEARRQSGDENVDWVLNFNHYKDGQYEYKDEQDIIEKWFEWIKTFDSKPLIIAQNASFDMAMMGGRGVYTVVDEAFDTKILLQLYYLPLLQKLAESDTKYQDTIDEIGTSSRDDGLISSSMGKVGPALGLDMSNYHDALSDCRITIKMFQRVVDILNANKKENIMKYQIERIRTKR